MNEKKIMKVVDIVPSDIDPDCALVIFDDEKYICINADHMEAIKNYYDPMSQAEAEGEH